MESNINDIYFRLTGKQLAVALLQFQQLSNTSARETGDLFFQAYGPGNTISFSDLPYERFLCYEQLLYFLQIQDNKKFCEIHKGTPYYFLGWTAFDFGDYGKAVFYIDAAFSEDIRISSGDIVAAMKCSAGGLLRLSPEESGPAARITSKIRQKTNSLISDFNDQTGRKITIQDFINNFVIKAIHKDAKNRSIITALYSYMLEYDDIVKIIEIGKRNETTLEPILLHLFKGGLIFESLLKIIVQKYEWNDENTLNKIFKKISSLDFFELKPDTISTYAPDFESIINDNNILTNSVDQSFSTTAKIRNVAGHDLRRNDIFTNKNDYKKLFIQEINAIFYVIEKVMNDF